MNELYIFILTFMFILLLYLLFIYYPEVRKKRKVKKKMPMEIRMLTALYKINLDKVNYKMLLLLVCFISSFDISLIVTLIMLTNNFLIEILIALGVIIPIILISYYPLGLYYKKRGKVNE